MKRAANTHWYRRVSIILSICLMIIVESALANNYSVEFIKNRNEIKSIAFEADTVWLGTNNGLIKMLKDGTYLNFFTEKEGLISNVIYSIEVDAVGNKWIGTNSGITRLYGNKTKSFKKADGLISSSVSDIATYQNTVWTSNSWYGLSMYNGIEWKSYSPDNSGLDSKYVKKIVTDQKGNLWIYFNYAYSKSLQKYDGTNWTTYTKANTSYGLAGNNITGMVIDKDNKIWISHENGVSVFDGTNWSNPSNASNIDGLKELVYENNILWASTGTSLKKYDIENNQWTEYTKYNGAIEINYIETINIDKEGNKWIGYSDYYNGVTKTSDGLTGTTYKVNSVVNSKITAMIKATNGDIWTGTEKGISKFDGTNWTNFNESNGLSDGKISSIFQNSNGDIWAGYIYGVMVYNGTTWTSYNSANTNNILKSRVHDVESDGNGNLYLSTEKGVIKYDGTTFTLFASTAELGVEFVTDIKFSSTGTMWVATRKETFGSSGVNGLAKYENSIWTKYEKKSGELTNSSTNKISIDNNNNVWLATNNGLTKFDGSTFTTYTDELTNDFIYTIHIDNNQKIWLGTEKGLTAYDGSTTWEKYNFYSTPKIPNYYQVEAICTDNNNKLWIGGSHGITVFTENPNTDPEIVLDNVNIDEGSEIDTKIGKFNISNDNTVYTYTLVSGNNDGDNGNFTIDNNILKLNTALNFESKSIYNIRVKTTNSSNVSFEKSFVIKVVDIYEAPTGISLSNISVVENSANGTTIGSFSSTDVDIVDRFSYNLTSGDGDGDNSLFTINSNELKVAGTLDYEGKKSLSVRVKVFDLGFLTFEKSFSIAVTNINEAPTDIMINKLNLPESSPIGTIIAYLKTNDQDTEDTHSYIFVQGAGDGDNSKFTINNNEIKLNTTLNYATTTSYSVRVKSSDGAGLSIEKTITISTINEAPTDIVSSTTSVKESVTKDSKISSLKTTDVDYNDTHTYTFAVGDGDTDNGSFAIVGDSLQLKSDLNFETKTSYSIKVKSTDSGGLSFVKTIIITIIDINEAPQTLILSASVINENSPSGTVIGTFSSTDSDANDVLSYTIITDTLNSSKFKIETNKLLSNAILNFEKDSSININCKVTDKLGLSLNKQLTISVKNINEAPTNITISKDSILDGSIAGSIIATLLAVDEDLVDTHSYSLNAGDGDEDNDNFSISSNELKIKKDVNYSKKSSYTIRIKVSDKSGLNYEKQLTIKVFRNNTAPTGITMSRDSIPENSAIGSNALILSSTDIDSNDSHTYTLISGTGDTDNSKFEIDSSKLIVKVGLDFETKSIYSIRVKSTDSGNLSYESVLKFKLTDVNEAATDILISKDSIPENSVIGTVIGSLSCIDVDNGDSHTYKLSVGDGDTDNGSFLIENDELKLNTNIDFEIKTSYSIRVIATDKGQLNFEKIITIHIIDIDENSTDIFNREATEMFKFYPNPSTTDITVKYNVVRYGKVMIKILDLQGRLIDICFESDQSIGEYEEYISVSEIPKGMYLISITINNRSELKRLIKL